MPKSIQLFSFLANGKAKGRKGLWHRLPVPESHILTMQIIVEGFNDSLYQIESTIVDVPQRSV